MHKRVKFYVDQTRSPRLDPQLHIDQSLNIANEKFFSVLVDTFQLLEYVRDEMKPLVFADAACTFTGNIIDFPAGYRHLLSLAVQIDNVWINFPVQMSYGEKSATFDNAFTEPVSEEPLYIESKTGITIYNDGNTFTGTINAVKMDYLGTPPQMYYSQTNILTGPAVLTIGQTYYVYQGTIVSNAVTYNGENINPTGIGDAFVAASTAFTGAGIVRAIQNCVLGETCHEEICKGAAAQISCTFEDWSRMQEMALQDKR